jgi:hypothetical protein
MRRHVAPATLPYTWAPPIADRPGCRIVYYSARIVLVGSIGLRSVCTPVQTNARNAADRSSTTLTNLPQALACLQPAGVLSSRPSNSPPRADDWRSFHCAVRQCPKSAEYLRRFRRIHVGPTSQNGVFGPHRAWHIRGSRYPSMWIRSGWPRIHAMLTVPCSAPYLVW